MPIDGANKKYAHMHKLIQNAINRLIDCRSW